jgi:TRAP-type C4-dicarboxylate transport system substrate-binding protein
LEATDPIAGAAVATDLLIHVAHESDLKLLGQELRCAPIEMHVAGELYTALENKTVDGQENPYTVILSNKFYEVQKYVSATNHAFTTAASWPVGQILVAPACSFTPECSISRNAVPG